ncbi:UNVERIFIED_CONTAM: hypothetical protein Sindi_2911900 [Sesamum indicum]
MEASRAAGDGLHPRPSAPGGTHTGGESPARDFRALSGVYGLHAPKAHLADGARMPPVPPAQPAQPAGPSPDSRCQNKANTTTPNHEDGRGLGGCGGRLAPARPQRPDPPQAPPVGCHRSRRAGCKPSPAALDASMFAGNGLLASAPKIGIADNFAHHKLLISASQATSGDKHPRPSNPDGTHVGPLMRGRPTSISGPTDQPLLGRGLCWPCFSKSQSKLAPDGLPLRTGRHSAHTMQMGIGRTQHRRPPLKRPAGVPLPDSRRQNKANTSHAQAMRTAEAWGLRGGRLAPARPVRPDPPQAPSSPYNRLKKKKACDRSRH